MNKNRITIKDDQLFYKGSIAGLNFYKKWDQYRARKKSSLTGKHFQNDAAFKGSRANAERFAMGNKLASRLYKLIEAEKAGLQSFLFFEKEPLN